MIKLIGLDLDDTLLNSKKLMNEEDILTLRKVIDYGLKICFVSGRPYTETIINYYKMIDGIKDKYYIAYNGVNIYNVYENKLVYSNSLNKKDILFINSIIKTIDGDFAQYGYYNNKVYTNKINEYVSIENKYNNVEIFIKDICELNSIDKYMLAGDPKIIKKIYESLDKNKLKDYNVLTSMPCFIEIFKKGIDKYEALRMVANFYGITDHEIMAIGDSMNDYSMVDKAFIGVAMGNSAEELKKVSDYVTDSNDNCGVSKVLKKYILGE